MTIFFSMIFIAGLESSHIGYRKSIPVAQQKNQICKEIAVVISIFLGSSVLYFEDSQGAVNDSIYYPEPYFVTLTGR